MNCRAQALAAVCALLTPPQELLPLLRAREQRSWWAGSQALFHSQQRAEPTPQSHSQGTLLSTSCTLLSWTLLLHGSSYSVLRVALPQLPCGYLQETRVSEGAVGTNPCPLPSPRQPGPAPQPHTLPPSTQLSTQPTCTHPPLHPPPPTQSSHHPSPTPPLSPLPALHPTLPPNPHPPAPTCTYPLHPSLHPALPHPSTPTHSSTPLYPALHSALCPHPPKALDVKVAWVPSGNHSTERDFQIPNFQEEAKSCVGFF